MREERKEEHQSSWAHIAPHWVVAAMAAIAIFTTVAISIRSEDLSKIQRNSNRIDKLITQVSTLASMEAVTNQRTSDLLDLLNRYMKGKSP